MSVLTPFKKAYFSTASIGFHYISLTKNSCDCAFWNQRRACLALPSEYVKLTKSSQWSSLFIYSLFVIWTNGNRQIIDLTMENTF